ncbi:MAG TPA: anhydro-N-acetylmuramic acid kinase [Chitinophagaceae bacterium]|nr:anhydro-N-acetylmuramic acid kinase [Chitinophagaceae bacterium]
MVYRAIGLMSGSSLDGLDIVYTEFHENAGKWNYEILHADCYPYSDEWITRLKNAVSLPALDYQLLHTDYGHYLGQQVNKFIEKNKLQYNVALITSHGHTSFHIPSKRMTAQLGDGAAIAAETQLPVVTDLRALDIALGGQGAPIVPIGEKLLLGDYDFFLNLGGIANLSAKNFINKKSFQNTEGTKYPSSKGEGSLGDEVAFDICPANRILNMLANELGKEYDAGGEIAASGKINIPLFEKLNALDYYKQPYPKSLANDFGTDIVYPLIKNTAVETKDALRTYVEHIIIQIKNAITTLKTVNSPLGDGGKLLATGGGAFNAFLIARLRDNLKETGIGVIIPGSQLVNYKEALIMALIGILRWRQEYNVLSSVTGAAKDSIGGALWIGQEA